MTSREDAPYLPLFFKLRDRPCLVVGGGEVAQRKVEQLLKFIGQVTIVAPEVTEGLREMLDPGRCIWRQRRYLSPEASGYKLVIATTDDPPTNRQIYRDCESRGIPVNVVDQPDLCTVIFPAIAKRGLITVAISSGGKAPFLTKELRKRLEDFLDDVDLLDKPELLVKFRDFVRTQTEDFGLKRRLYQRLLSCSREQWSQWSEENPPYGEWREWLQDKG